MCLWCLTWGKSDLRRRQRRFLKTRSAYVFCWIFIVYFTESLVEPFNHSFSTSFSWVMIQKFRNHSFWMQNEFLKYSRDKRTSVWWIGNKSFLISAMLFGRPDKELDEDNKSIDSNNCTIGHCSETKSTCLNHCLVKTLEEYGMYTVCFI